MPRLWEAAHLLPSRRLRTLPQSRCCQTLQRINRRQRIFWTVTGAISLAAATSAGAGLGALGHSWEGTERIAATLGIFAFGFWLMYVVAILSGHLLFITSYPRKHAGIDAANQPKDFAVGMTLVCLIASLLTGAWLTCTTGGPKG